MAPAKDDDDNAAVTTVAKEIVCETNMLNQDKSTHQTRISKCDGIANTSPTLIGLFLKVSSTVSNLHCWGPTPPQISLGVVLRETNDDTSSLLFLVALPPDMSPVPEDLSTPFTLPSPKQIRFTRSSKPNVLHMSAPCPPS